MILNRSHARNEDEVEDFETYDENGELKMKAFLKLIVKILDWLSCIIPSMFIVDGYVKPPINPTNNNKQLTLRSASKKTPFKNLFNNPLNPITNIDNQPTQETL